jgi:hypothetical protein
VAQAHYRELISRRWYETVLGLTDRLVPVTGERGAYRRAPQLALAG